jgi:CheY-like chemotaxis protein
MSNKGVILIADDEQEFLVSSSALLRSQGYECDCVKDSQAAVNRLRERQYDLLIADIEMPGNQNLSLIRNVPQITKGLPVIIVTGHPSIQTAAQSVQLAVSAYLLKPIDPDDLFSAVEQAVGRFRAYQVVSRHWRRLQENSQDMQYLESLMRTGAGCVEPVPWHAFPNMTLLEILESLREMENYVLVMAGQKGSPAGSVDENAPSPAVLLAAIQQTIEVLEKTKNAFKSKDLGDLRRKLQALVEIPEPTPPSNNPPKH